MLIKAGVDISRLKREIRRSLKEVNIFVEKYKDELTITSTFEGNHGCESLHYANQAYDISRPLTVNNGSLNGLRGLLGKDYDIVWKVDHIHVEYDPKKR